MQYSISKAFNGLLHKAETILPSQRYTLTSKLIELVTENQRLRQSQAFLDSIIENIPDMIFIKDAKTLRFVKFNKAGERLLKVSSRELIGKSDYDIFPKDQADFFTSKDREVLNGTEAVEIDDEPLETSAGVRYLHTKKIPICDKRGRPRYLLGISEDITEKKIATKAAAELEKEQASNHAKRAFIAAMSHEIRNPVGIIMGYVELLLTSNNLTDDQKQLLKTILKNSNLLLKIVNESLDMSKIEANKVSVEYSEFSFLETVAQVITSLQLKADKKGVKINFQSCDSIPKLVVTDPTRFIQILTNLVDNAIKFTSTGEVNIFAKTIDSNIDENKTTIKISVIDTGMGIPNDKQKTLFQPFAQADKSVSKRFGGSGLGLYVSKKLAQVLGGDLILSKSTEGQGSCFDLIIPVTLPNN